ncbi:hypothetical protein F8388_016228 [Cannabis sativa]|uniref:Uncharacterized protein n=1 Tax=Cannabis sativa TaxID=3483 RepID=A0A7J6GEL5_CANSA|nr:hypothetical protein F8388_016228 [Cannabis sativa]
MRIPGLPTCLLREDEKKALVPTKTKRHFFLSEVTSLHPEFSWYINLEEGWPLGLRPLNARLGLISTLDISGSASFNTSLTASPTSSTISSSDLDTEIYMNKRAPFLQPKIHFETAIFFLTGKTLGNLIGVSSIFQLSRRSTRGRTPENLSGGKILKSKPWRFSSLCSKLTTDAVTDSNNTPSLGHFLETERTRSRTSGSNIHKRSSRSPLYYGPNDYSPAPTISNVNSLFVDGLVAPCPSTSSGSISRDRPQTELLEGGNNNGFGVSLVIPCLCGQVIN